MNKIHYKPLLIKILILFLFNSQFNNDLFINFVRIFCKINSNPWNYYLLNNLNLDAFPYHSLMLYLLVPFLYLADIFQVYGLFKLPLLFADLGILYILLKLFPHKERSVYVFYFLNPIVIYAIYIHSQLDIIPTYLLCASIYLLILQRLNYSALFFGCALATKFHIIIALPLVLFYLYKAVNVKKVFVYLFIAVSIFLHLICHFYLVMVFSKWFYLIINNH